MSDPAIRAALEAACATDAFWQGGDGPADADVMRDRVAAITAFLREIGGRYLETMDGPMMSMRHLAAAVEEAARDG